MKLYNVHYTDFPTQKGEVIGQVMLWELDEIVENFGPKADDRQVESVRYQQNWRIIQAFIISRFPHMWSSGADSGIYEFSEWDKEKKRIHLKATVYVEAIG